MIVRIYDGNLVVRQRLETDTSGFVIRNLAIEAANTFGVLEIWVFDHPAGNARRRAMYSEYKTNREPPAENIYAFMQLWQAVVKLTPAYSCVVPGYEGDDVIAHLARRYVGLGAQVEVITRDADIRQLEIHPGIRVKNDSLGKVPPHLIRLYKATVGDSSDNIKGVPGFGAKTWETCDKERLLAWFEAPFDAEPPADLPNRCRTAMSADRQHFLMLYDLVSFIDIPEDEVTANIVAGRFQPEVVEKILAELLM